MQYKSALRNVYVCISEKKKNYSYIKSTITDNIKESHNVVFNDMAGYEPDKDIIISDGYNSYISDVAADIGLGEDYSGNARYIVYNSEDITKEYCEHIFARKMGVPVLILETERYIVREECEDDLKELYGLYATLSDCEYIEQLYEENEEREFVRNYIDNMYGFFDYGLWLVYDRSTGELVGRMGIENRSIDGSNCQELGYLVGKNYQNKGTAYEVCSAIISYAKEYLGIDELYACIHKDNKPSIGLIKKLGFSEYAKDIDGMNIYYLFIPNTYLMKSAAFSG